MMNNGTRDGIKSWKIWNECVCQHLIWGLYGNGHHLPFIPSYTFPLLVLNHAFVSPAHLFDPHARNTTNWKLGKGLLSSWVFWRIQLLSCVLAAAVALAL